MTSSSRNIMTNSIGHVMSVDCPQLFSSRMAGRMVHFYIRLTHYFIYCQTVLSETDRGVCYYLTFGHNPRQHPYVVG